MTDSTYSDELPPVQRPPWATMATALAVLFVFAILVVLIMAKGKDLSDPSAGVAGASQLSDLRAQEREILENYRYNPETDSWQIPIDQAMNALIDEAKSNNGALKTFPTRPREDKKSK